MDRGSLELLLGQGLSVEKIAKRFGKHPSTVSYWLAKHGLTASTARSMRRGAGSNASASNPWSRRG
jgi:transposase